MKIGSILFATLLFLNSECWGADDQACPDDQQIFISSIEIFGNTKTSVDVIKRELGLALDDRVCESKVQDAIKRLKSTGLFVSVEYQITYQSPSGQSHIQVTVTEKWTTIPILKVNSGGGVSQYTLGVYDPNIFGKFLEAGVQYENLSGANSGVTWFKNPRLFGKRQGVDLQYWNTKRIRIKYDQDLEDPEIKRGFLHEREKVYADYFREFSSSVTARVSIDYNNDSFSTDVLPASVLEKIGPNPSLPPSTELLILRFGLEVGRIEGEPQALSGQMFGAYFGQAHPLDGDTDPFVQGDLSYQLFYPKSSRLQLAQRLLVGATSTKVLQYWYYLGGLDRIRGFADNRFAGSHFALSNSEARLLILNEPSVLGQTVGFLDFGAIGEEFSALTKVKAASVGAGLRLILPKFYRFVIRLDYGKPILKNDTMNWSLGVQQFF
jgi:outer membrane protein assembly factor BamA